MNTFFLESYRYGFQGQERDDEVKGAGNSVNYKYRMHDPRLGRFFAVDPLASKYPYNSVYAFSENDVIAHVELEGLEKSKPRYYWFRGNGESIVKKESHKEPNQTINPAAETISHTTHLKSSGDPNSNTTPSGSEALRKLRNKEYEFSKKDMYKNAENINNGKATTFTIQYELKAKKGDQFVVYVDGKQVKKLSVKTSTEVSILVTLSVDGKPHGEGIVQANTENGAQEEIKTNNPATGYDIKVESIPQDRDIKVIKPRITIFDRTDVVGVKTRKNKSGE